MTDISAVITAHREGTMAGVSLRSLISAVAVAREAGLVVEILVVLDDPNDTTRAVFADCVDDGISVLEVSFKDQGLVRNYAVGVSKGRYIAFLDGDDLWGENWLPTAFDMCQSEAGKIIAHPELDWFFGASNNLFFHADQTDPGFDPAFLRFGNYWDALCLAPREAYERHPYSHREVQQGYAYEDWLWNIETLDDGFVHRVVPGTIHFKRRRNGSQTMIASGSKTLTRPHRFFSYEWSSTAD